MQQAITSSMKTTEDVQHNRTKRGRVTPVRGSVIEVEFRDDLPGSTRRCN